MFDFRLDVSVIWFTLMATQMNSRGLTTSICLWRFWLDVDMQTINVRIDLPRPSHTGRLAGPVQLPMSKLQHVCSLFQQNHIKETSWKDEDVMILY